MAINIIQYPTGNIEITDGANLNFVLPGGCQMTANTQKDELQFTDPGGRQVQQLNPADLGTFTDINSVQYDISGGLSAAYDVLKVEPLELGENDRVKVQVRNISGNANVTALQDSYLVFEER